jgi:hypothetical protein
LNIKKLIKSLLFIFLVVSLVVLIYKEFSPKSESNATDVTVTKSDATSASGKFLPVPENHSSKEPATKQKEEVPLPRTEVKSQASKIIAYYFHGTFRCTTCRTIEQYSHDAIQTYFAKELGNGKLEFRPVNVEEPDNRHFLQEYQLFSKSLVLSLVTDGKEIKWKNLTDVWKYVSDKERFFQYVKDEVKIFLKEDG